MCSLLETLALKSGCELVAEATQAPSVTHKFAVSNVLLCPRNWAQTLITPVYDPQGQPAGEI